MKRALKWIGILLGIVAVVAAGGVTYLMVAYPKVPAASALKVNATPELLARGKYLAESVTVCTDCHSTRDWSKFSGPPTPGTEGKGGERFDESFGFPGKFIAQNITPTALSSWSDGEIARAFTMGVSKDGRAYFPVMPYPLYKHLCERDVQAIVAYVRAMKPQDAKQEPSKAKFPMNLILRTIPEAAQPWPCPDASQPSTERGKYLAHVAGCIECHTKSVRGKKVPGMTFAGGFEFKMPGAIVRSSNLTPEPQTGLTMNREAFIARFKSYLPPAGTPAVAPGQKQTVMPWSQYAGMTPEDLGAIYDYLRTLPPVANKVETFTPVAAK